MLDICNFHRVICKVFDGRKATIMGRVNTFHAITGCFYVGAFTRQDMLYCIVQARDTQGGWAQLFKSKCHKFWQNLPSFKKKLFFNCEQSIVHKASFTTHSLDYGQDFRCTWHQRRKGRFTFLINPRIQLSVRLLPLKMYILVQENIHFGRQFVNCNWRQIC